MSELSKIAFRFNTALGQIEMAKGCIKFLPLYASSSSNFAQNSALRSLDKLKEELKLDYKLTKSNLLRAKQVNEEKYK